MLAAEKQPTAHPALKAYLAFHCFMILTWSIPEAPAALQGPEFRLSWANLVVHRDDWIKVAAARLKQVAIPIPGAGHKLEPYREYVMRTGLWQRWSMFAPDPGKIDLYLDQLVIFQNGAVKTHHYPRMSRIPLGPRYFRERYRKYVEHVYPDSQGWKWPAFAQRIAYEEFADPANPPVKVILRRHWKVIQPMDEVPWMDERSFTYFEHVVDKAELMAAKRW